jgi:two-component system nitrogen regulation sensor histidine kinase NtrY
VSREFTELPKRRSLAGWLAGWATSLSLERWLAICLMICGGVCGLATYFLMTGTWRVHEGGQRLISWLLLGDGITALALGLIVARRVVLLFVGRRRGLAGAKLHARLVLLFGLVAIIPTLVLSALVTLFLNYGLDVWFSKRIQDAVESSLNFANAYSREQQERINIDAASIAKDLVRSGALNTPIRGVLTNFLEYQMKFRDLSEALVINRQRQVIASGFSPLVRPNIELSPNAFAIADAGNIANVPSYVSGRVRALVLLDARQDLYLYVGRVVDSGMASAQRKYLNAVELYHQLELNRTTFQIRVGLIFPILALLILMGAIWVAIVSATQIVKPISRLASAAEQIGAGELGVRVKIGHHDDELSGLSRTFNVMAIQLQNQQHAIMAVNRQLDDRRRFTELVLSGVSAGVIGLADDGTIDFPNRSASELLGVDLMDLVGKPISAVSPEMAEIVERARARNSGTADGQINFNRGTIHRTLHVRVVSEVGDEGHTKLVVTFDDVSELLSAQRKAAWSDIARRIAHEIKNPLTPIQLSAERLKRKYLRQITEDPETFTACTETIVRQVGDIGRMVDEFSAFARMPAPVLRMEDACELARQAAFLQQNAHPAIKYVVDLPEEPVPLVCDASQVNRALTNLMKNAAESIEEWQEEQRSKGDGMDLAPHQIQQGQIHLWARRSNDRLLIGIDDNGRGLPEQGRDRLTEPYVTTRSKGTGLGLAIVKKILEDHGGTLSLKDREGGGASILLTFPIDVAPSNIAESNVPESAIPSGAEPGRTRAAAGTA